MKRSYCCCLLIISAIFLLLTAPLHHAYAQNPITISDNQVVYHFGSDLKIVSRITSDEVQGSVYIILQPEGQLSRQISLTPDADGKLTFDYDLHQDPLKPFSRVYYWYQFESVSGSVVNSPSFWFDYIDNRYEWKQLSSKLFNVYWTEEDSAFGQQVMDIATAGLERATSILPVAPDLPISIFVYPDITSLQAALSAASQTFVAGHASPEIGVVLISDGKDQTSMIELERQIPHELMHVLQYQVLGSAYTDSPAWLLEGMATLVQSYPNADNDRILNSAIETNSLIPLGDLCESLPIEADTHILGYAQSAAVVEYLKDTFGSQVFLSMFDSVSKGLSCEQVIVNHTELTSEQLLSAWLMSAYPESRSSSQNNTFILIMAGVIVMASVSFIIIREIIRKKKARDSHV